MVQFDNQYRQVKLKVVYYGPALGGKTTCLQYIHRITDPQRRSRLYTLNTASDRTLFFDLLGLDLGRIRGYRLTLQLFTVPGQVQYNTTRRAVLAGADGVVFVADSQASQERANLESWNNLVENLRANGLDPETIPLVLQYNKRDLPGVLSKEQLNRLLNPKGYPAFETVATTGLGVMEAFSAICEATVLSVADRLGITAQGDALTRLVANVRAAIAPLVPSKRPEVEAPVVLRTAATGTLEPQELVAEAVRANTAMADLSARLDQLSKQLRRRVEELQSILVFSQTLSQAREPDEVTTAFFERFLVDLRVTAGSLLLLNPRNELVEVLRRGLAAEPTMRRASQGEVPAQSLLTSRQVFRLDLSELAAGQGGEAWVEEVRGLGFQHMLAVPLVVRDHPLGLVTAYGEAQRGAFQDEDLELAAIMGAVGAMAMANARAWHSLEQVNRNLEGLVEERTAELQRALQRAEALTRQLEAKNRELEVAYGQLEELDRLKGELLRRVAHELNTPVTAIQTAARILARWEQIPKEKVANFVGIVAEESARLAELIASTLHAAALGAGVSGNAKTSVAVAELLRQALAPVKGEIADRQIKVSVKVAAGLERVTCFAEQLTAALTALLKNAVEFNNPEGSVTVTVVPVRQQGRSLVEFRVEDSGVGIPPEELPYVTEPFFQGGALLTGKPKGLGLGLAVAKRVAEMHHGSLEIVSQVGQGTRVSLTVAVE
ncbi:MAG: ATP-binding protein [Thermoanaerobaculum sp.]|nr:ATP-binding protein [Thermoanaerobaculum sp.]MDW7967177.1 ATP-binding protein [Thermoanaerobaculum sp.]